MRYFPNLRTSPSLSYLNGPCRSKCKKEFLRWLPRWNRSLVSPLLLQNQPSFSDSWVDNASISFGDKPSLGSVPLANDVLWLKLRVAKPASKPTKDSMLQLFSLGHPPSEGNTVVFWACGRGVQPSMVVPKHLCDFANCGFECQRNICHCKLFFIAWVWMSLPHMSNIVYSKNTAIERFSKIGHTGLDSRAQLAMPPFRCGGSTIGWCWSAGGIAHTSTKSTGFEETQGNSKGFGDTKSTETQAFPEKGSHTESHSQALCCLCICSICSVEEAGIPRWKSERSQPHIGLCIQVQVEWHLGHQACPKGSESCDLMAL